MRGWRNVLLSSAAPWTTMFINPLTCCKYERIGAERPFKLWLGHSWVPAFWLWKGVRCCPSGQIVPPCLWEGPGKMSWKTQKRESCTLLQSCITRGHLHKNRFLQSLASAASAHSNSHLWHHNLLHSSCLWYAIQRIILPCGEWTLTKEWGTSTLLSCTVTTRTLYCFLIHLPIQNGKHWQPTSRQLSWYRKY